MDEIGVDVALFIVRIRLETAIAAISGGREEN
jgi:hypothetical protein